MKKCISLLMALVLSMCVLAGCGAGESAVGGSISGTPEEIIAKIYENHREIQLALVGQELDLTDGDAVTYFTGLQSAEKLSAAAVSETMLGQPYSLVVVKVKNAADAASVAKEMYDGIDTRKWICVAADTKAAAYCGDVVVFFMVSSDFAEDADTTSVMDAFEAACGGKINRIG